MSPTNIQDLEKSKKYWRNKWSLDKFLIRPAKGYEMKYSVIRPASSSCRWFSFKDFSHYSRTKDCQFNIFKSNEQLLLKLISPLKVTNYFYVKKFIFLQKTVVLDITFSEYHLHYCTTISLRERRTSERLD